MTEKQKKIVKLLSDIIPGEAEVSTGVKGIHLFRVDKSFKRSPYSYNSEIIIMGQGEKKVHLGHEVFHYDFSHYLVLPVPLPAECEGKAEPGKPILGLTIDIDPIEIGEILLDMEDVQKETLSVPKGIYSATMNEPLYDAVIRLLQAIVDSQDKKILAPIIKKEIIYRVLQGEKGEILQAITYRSKRFFHIAKILRKIHDDYSRNFDMEKLASELNMSISTFHSCFKSVTGISPLQYIKQVRLHKARAFLIQDGFNANVAAQRVGYESSSQFNREYKRLFGVTPAKDSITLSPENN